MILITLIKNLNMLTIEVLFEKINATVYQNRTITLQTLR